jgi:hypothetical protein
MITLKNQKTLDKLIRKANLITGDKTRMPSIKQLHLLLDELGVEHRTGETQNTVEYRSSGNRYVNSRHDGKIGKSLEIKINDDGGKIILDTSESYYSWNSGGHARDIVRLLVDRKLIKKVDLFN